MKFLSNIFLFSFLIVVLCFSYQNALGCSCGSDVSSVYEEFDRYPIVFSGKIVSSEDKYIGGFYYYEKLYRFKILKSYKGEFEEEVLVSVGENSSSCYSELVVGETYLIYANKEGQKIVYSVCSTSSTIENARDQIKFIEEHLSGKPESQIYGSVSVWENDLQTNEQRSRYLDKVKVKVKSQERSFETVTDKNGIYRFNNMPEGKFEISVNLQNYNPDYPETHNIEVDKDGNILRDFDSSLKGVYVDFNFYLDNEIKGKILDGEGNAKRNVRINLIPVSATNNVVFKGKTESYGYEGKYRIFGKTPGQYLLVAELDSPMGKDNKIRFFYPNTTSPNNAKIFTIEDTTKLEVDFKLPNEIITRKLSVHILANKEIPEGSYFVVSLDSMKNVEHPENKQFEIKPLDDGVIEFGTLENEEYWMHIWLNHTDYSNAEVKEIKKLIKEEKIKIGKELKTRKISVTLP